MDELIPALFILIATVAGIISSAKKEHNSKAAMEAHRAAAASRLQSAQQKVHTQASIQPASPARSAAMKPTVHPHLQPECEVHDAQGSMKYTSPEGIDPCHSDQLSDMRSSEAASASQPGLTFSWTGDSMVKAVVMQEILTRPCQRRSR